MNNTHNAYREILERKAAEVRQAMSAERAAQVLTRAEHPHDEGDLSQQSHEEWLFLNRNTLEMQLLRELEGALRRIEQGTYGTCAECEEPISIKRLNALPWARFCVSCQERLAASGELQATEDWQAARR